jgi:hypothetical protein
MGAMALDRLPGVLGEIEEVAGREAALAIARAYGGSRKGFPSPATLKRPCIKSSDNWLVGVVGIETAIAIVEAIFPIGGRVDIPLAQRALREQFVLAHSEAQSVAEMAASLHSSERGVRHTKSRLRAKGLLK